jgi:predicted amidohydrolase
MTSAAAKRVLGGRERIKVCIAQVSPVYLNRDATVLRAVATIREAGANGADLVVFPETWLSGYPYWTEGWDSSLREWAAGRIRFFDEALLVPSAATEAIGRAAREARVHVVMGCNEIDPRPGNGTIYNSLVFFDRSGTIMGRHRKLMPTFIERLFWGSGDGNDLEVYDTDIGRIGGLICGENLMTPLRAAMIGMGEDIHIAVFPGAFSLDVGPRLQEWDMTGRFWGHFVTRAHALEGGCFVCCVSAFVDPNDVAQDVPHRSSLHMDWARGGSQIVSPLGMPIVGPVEGAQLIYAECHAWMIKAVKAIVDTLGHYGRADAVRVQIRKNDHWQLAGEAYGASRLVRLDPAALERAADTYEVAMDRVEEIADARQMLIAKS